MLEAQAALVTYSSKPDSPKSHEQLIEELHQATKDFLDCVGQLAENPPTRLVPD